MAQLKKRLTQVELDVLARLWKLGVLTSELDFSNFNLNNLVFKNIDLAGWDFRNSSMQRVSFINCEMDSYSGSFSGANLKGVKFDDKTLQSACFDKQRGNDDFYKVYLNGAINVPVKYRFNPKHSPNALVDARGRMKKDVTAFKKIYVDRGGYKTAIVELVIPKGTPAVVEPQPEHHLGKCRAESAKVISIKHVNGTGNYTTGRAAYDSSFKYNVGETVKVDNFDPEPTKACRAGIHFFLTRRGAETYSL